MLGRFNSFSVVVVSTPGARWVSRVEVATTPTTK
jgi:hypothetical protein